MSMQKGDLSIQFLQSVYPEFYTKVKRSAESRIDDSICFSAGDTAWDSLPSQPSTVEEQRLVISSLPRKHVSRNTDKPVVVILAGGKGSRMVCDEGQKVLCPISGIPAILRAVRMFQRFGITEFVIVVGVGYRKVISCLRNEKINVSYLFQEQQMGTGHAGRLAARYLRYCNYDGDVLVVMGDKFISRRALEKIFADHADSGADLTISAASKSAWPDAGRIILNESGCVLAIIEKPDIVLMQLLYDFQQWEVDPVPADLFKERALQYWNRPEKWAKMLGEEFWSLLHRQKSIPKNVSCLPVLTPDFRFQISDSYHLLGREVEARCRLVNLSVYLFKAKALYESTENLRADNAQGELYLTDAAHFLTLHSNDRLYTIFASAMPDDNDVMGFNTLEELERIELYAREKNLLEED